MIKFLKIIHIIGEERTPILNLMLQMLSPIYTKRLGENIENLAGKAR